MVRSRRIFIILLVLGAGLVSGCCYYFKSSSSFYGVATRSRSVVFLVDVSGSMEWKAEKDISGAVLNMATSATAKTMDRLLGSGWGSCLTGVVTRQMTKMVKAKKQLAPAVRGLSDDTRFTIIAFENTLHYWKKEPVEATKGKKNKAAFSISRLKADGGTNIYEALEQSFEMAGPGTTDSSAVPEVQTIFLLTDGTPSTGAVTNPDRILEKVKGWNPLGRVVIHTIGLGDDQDKQFLAALAAQNGGQYIYQEDWLMGCLLKIF